MVTREIDNHRLARQRDTPWRVRNSFIHYLAGASKAANKLELEYMYNGYPDVGILPPGYDLFHILESRGICLINFVMHNNTNVSLSSPAPKAVALCCSGSIGHEETA